ncbi:hypothetical protein QFZ43_002011 [Streptomyces afghaniensis]|nr:hypothetical protein [Streptomyces afghaniensis]
MASDVMASVLPRASVNAPGQPRDLADAGLRRLQARRRVDLPGDDHQADAAEHALDDGDGYRPEPAAYPQEAHGELEQAGHQHDHTERGHTELADGLEDQHGHARGGAGHLEAAAGQEPGDEAAHDAGDQAEFGRDAGGDGHADAQRHGDEEDDDGGEEVLPQVRELGHGVPHRVSKVSVSAWCCHTVPVCTS